MPGFLNNVYNVIFSAEENGLYHAQIHDVSLDLVFPKVLYLTITVFSVFQYFISNFSFIYLKKKLMKTKKLTKLTYRLIFTFKNISLLTWY